MRIISSALSSSATPVPAAQLTASIGSSFQAVLAGASTDHRADSKSTSDGAKGMPAVGEGKGTKEDTTATTAGETTLTADGTVAVKRTGIKDWAPTLELAGATSAPASAPSSETVVSGSILPGAVISPTPGYLQMTIASASASVVGSVSLAVVPASASTTDGTTVRPATKQDRSKGQPDLKHLGIPATTDVAVVDQSKIPIVSLPSWQDFTHAKNLDAVGNTTKVVASVDSAKTQSKQEAPAAAEVAPAAATATPNVTPGPEVAQLLQAPNAVTEAGFESLTVSGLAGSAPAGVDDGIQGVSKSINMATPALTDSGNRNVTPDAGSLNGASAGSGDNPSHAGTNSDTVTAGVQADHSKLTAGAVVRVTEGANIQGTVQTIVHEGVTSQRPTTATADAPHTATTENLPVAAHIANADTVGASGINSAKIIQTVGQTEMHVGMHSEEFGDISIRTSLSQQQMVTQISLGHSDLSQTIAAHLSTVQAKLGEEYGVHASIEVNNQGSALAGGQADSSQRDQQAFARSAPGNIPAANELNESASSVLVAASAGSGHGLDIRV